MEIVTRKEWGAAPAQAGPGPLDPRQVEGIALHWPGDSVERESQATVSRALRGWQDMHMHVKGWSDIAYQEAVDQAGRVYLLRGLSTQSGANGDTDVNERFGAILLVVAIGETPSQLLVDSVRDRVARHRALFPNSHRIVPHSAIRPAGTECPGDQVRALIERGAFEKVDAPVTVRGEHVDEALRQLTLAVGTGERRKAIDKAIAATRAVPKLTP